MERGGVVNKYYPPRPLLIAIISNDNVNSQGRQDCKIKFSEYFQVLKEYTRGPEEYSKVLKEYYYPALEYFPERIF